MASRAIFFKWMWDGSSVTSCARGYCQRKSCQILGQSARRLFLLSQTRNSRCESLRDGILVCGVVWSLISSRERHWFYKIMLVLRVSAPCCPPSPNGPRSFADVSFLCTNIVPLDMKGCICHFVRWQIHPFISNGTNYNGLDNQNRFTACNNF